eukprot:scaffold2505_cov150-Amphora_coffeaeformis.AAC.1
MKQIDLQNEMLHAGMATASLILTSSSSSSSSSSSQVTNEDDAKQCLADKGVRLEEVPAEEGQDIFAYVRQCLASNKNKGDNSNMNALTLFRRIVGAANEFKEGDLTIGVAAANPATRLRARQLLANTTIQALQDDTHNPTLFRDAIYDLIKSTTQPLPAFVVDTNMTLGQLKTFVLQESEESIKQLMPALASDTIACLIKLMSNEELIQIGQKVFNPLPGSKIGSKGYLSARIQPNSPTDNTTDILWQVFNGWSYAVGDLVLGCNPVSSEPDSVAAIEKTLNDVRHTFGVQDLLSHCVLSHVDVQAQAEQIQPNSTGI